MKKKTQNLSKPPEKFSQQEWMSRNDWIPNDPTYTVDQWNKIKNAIQPAGLDVSNICFMILRVVGEYEYTAVNEKLPKIKDRTSTLFRSQENRKQLRRSIKAMTELKSIFSSVARSDPRTQRTYKQKALRLLSNRQLRAVIFNKSKKLNENVASIISGLENDKTKVPVKRFIATLDRIINIYQENLKAASAGGRPKHTARKNLIEGLVTIWWKATGFPPKIDTAADDYSKKSLFLNFVRAVFYPISSDRDAAALEEAVKEAAYPRHRRCKKS